MDWVSPAQVTMMQDILQCWKTPSTMSVVGMLAMTVQWGWRWALFVPILLFHVSLAVGCGPMGCSSARLTYTAKS